MSSTARSADRLPTAYAVWCVLRAGGTWTPKSMAAQVDGAAYRVVRAILPTLMQAGYAARDWHGGAPRHGGCWAYRVARDPAPLVPRVVLANGRARVDLLADQAAREHLNPVRRPKIRPQLERSATAHICTAVLRYGLRDAARLLGVAPERLAQRTRTLASSDADECRDLLRSITAEGRIVEPLGTDLAELAEPFDVDLGGEPPRREGGQGKGGARKWA